jgi:hypothetical protein
VNVSVSLLDGGEGPHLEHITPDVVEPVVNPVKESVNLVLLEQGVVVVDVSWALHRIQPPEVNLVPETLQIGVEFLKGTASLFQASNMSPEFIDLKGITPIKKCCSNSIPNCFSNGKSDEISGECQVHRVDQPSFDDGVFGSPSSKGWVSRRWWRIVTVDISQFVFARDIHLDNLGPKAIVGTVQLDTNWGSGMGWGLDFR